MNFSSFRSQLLTVIESLDTNAVKTSIGDSTDNHRNLTVSQLIRYLSTRRNTDLKQLGNYLKSVYNSDVRVLLANQRFTKGLVRNDAFDISELTEVLKSYGFQLSRILKSA